MTHMINCQVSRRRTQMHSSYTTSHPAQVGKCLQDKLHMRLGLRTTEKNLVDIGCRQSFPPMKHVYHLNSIYNSRSQRCLDIFQRNRSNKSQRSLETSLQDKEYRTRRPLTRNRTLEGNSYSWLGQTRLETDRSDRNHTVLDQF